jgi:hypothetical protein
MGSCSIILLDGRRNVQRGRSGSATINRARVGFPPAAGEREASFARKEAMSRQLADSASSYGLASDFPNQQHGAVLDHANRLTREEKMGDEVSPFRRCIQHRPGCCLRLWAVPLSVWPNYGNYQRLVARDGVWEVPMPILPRKWGATTRRASGPKERA